MEVTNSFGDAQPPLSNFRLAGLAAHDPDRTQVGKHLCTTVGHAVTGMYLYGSGNQHNFVHVAVGSGDVAFPVVEWKDTQDDMYCPLPVDTPHNPPYSFWTVPKCLYLPNVYISDQLQLGGGTMDERSGGNQPHP